MAIRYIRFTVSDDGVLTPATPQFGGVQGEHNATQVSFYLHPTSQLSNPNYQYHVECVDAAGGYDRTGQLTRVGSEIPVLVPLAWTQYGGISILRLVIEEQGTHICTLEGRLQFEDRGGAIEKMDGLLRTDIRESLDDCHESVNSCNQAQDACREAADLCRDAMVECERIRRLDSAIAAAAASDAADRANEAADEADVAADRANDAADDAAAVRAEIIEGGFIESLRELNRGDKFRVWVGSQQDYDALDGTPVNTLCILDDEEVADYVIEQGSAIVDGITWRYQKWHSGICRLWAYLTLKPQSSTGNGSSFYSESFIIAFPFTVGERVVTGNASNRCTVVNMASGGSDNYTDMRLLKPVDFSDMDKTDGVDVNLTVDGTWK